MKSTAGFQLGSVNLHHLGNAVQTYQFNPLTTDDECTRHENLAACYQLVQSVLKIGFALAKMVAEGEVGRDMLCIWQLSWLPVEKPWLALAEPFLSFFLHKWAQKRLFCLCRGSISDTLDKFQSGEVFNGRRALTTVSLLITLTCTHNKAQLLNYISTLLMYFILNTTIKVELWQQET